MSQTCIKCVMVLPDNARYCSACGTIISGEPLQDAAPISGDSELLARLQAEVGDEYVIARELGRGGMAIVYLGHDSRLGRKVAVKLLSPELTFGAGSSMVERFRREARTAATLDHPNIIPVYRVSQGGKLFWYAMKYLSGEALDRILERERQLGVDRVIELVRQTADALDYAHQNHVVHRDVKPANVMVDSRGRITVTDFGIAKAMHADTLTASGSIIGTPYYMSPEQCSGKRVGPASDQYSLGVMTYQMLSGRLPFTGESAVDIVRQHVTEQVPPLWPLRPQLSSALIEAVERSLVKHPEHRFASCGEFAKELARASLSVTVPTPLAEDHSHVASRVAGATAQLGTGRSRSQPAKGVGRWWRITLRGVAAVALLAGGFGGYILISKLLDDAPSTLGAAHSADQSTGTIQNSIDTLSSVIDDSLSSRAAQATSEASQPSATQLARLTLGGVPAGATVMRDGQVMRGTTIALQPGRRYLLSVSKPGFHPWFDTVEARAGERLRIPLALMPKQEQEIASRDNPAAAGPPPATPSQESQKLEPVTQPVVESANSVAYLSIGSRPNSAMLINGRAVPTNPITGYEVPAGLVRVRFLVTDSTGPWNAIDTTFTVAPGERKTIGYVRLRRMP